ncbi:hypothetical protein [Paraburkholderia elongata]|uniref:Uncharacterized protein n=1 Tax=Paraburkholderia elongata TaxID=2675747 RepID=A0A972NNZ5_9BURK|nr:hypothetical protein [Paraburkholderia elongata]NPT56401.1 hypothetical protein [Paraburkholderia elongata]
MNDDSLDICDIDVQNDASDRCDTESVLNETPRADRSTPAPASNWAWAHRCEAYDWMDSHGPFSTEGLWG